MFCDDAPSYRRFESGAIVSILFVWLPTLIYACIDHRLTHCHQFTQQLQERIGSHSEFVILRFGKYFPQLNDRIVRQKEAFLKVPLIVCWVAMVSLDVEGIFEYFFRNGDVWF